MNVAADKQLYGKQADIQHLFRSAYFLFCGETAHTTHWRNLLSTLALNDHSRSSSTFLKSSPANAYFCYQQPQQLTLNSFGGNLSKQTTTKLADIVKFALTADECTDINGCEMVSITVHYRNDKEIIEWFVFTSLHLYIFTSCFIISSENFSWSVLVAEVKVIHEWSPVIVQLILEGVNRGSSDYVIGQTVP